MARSALLNRSRRGNGADPLEVGKNTASSRRRLRAEENLEAARKKQAHPSRRDLERLRVFLGKWYLRGRQLDSLVGPAAEIAAVESFEWLNGGLFLVHRFEGRVGAADAACIEVIGYDASTGDYSAHTFYNDGKTHEWQLREHDGVWVLTGNWEMDGQPVKVRRTTVFDASGNTMTSKWEYSSDGSKWQAFWDVRATKAA